LTDTKQNADCGNGLFGVEATGIASIDQKRLDSLREYPIDSVKTYKPEPFKGPSGIKPAIRDRFYAMRTARELFCLFFDSTLMQFILGHTNDWGTASGKQYGLDWQPMTETILYAVIGTMIVMSVFRCHDLKLYWNEHFGNTLIRSVWPRNTFMRYYHAIRICSEPKPSNEAKDRLWIVNGMNDRLNDRFKAVLDPGPYVSLDETMIASRHHHPSFQKVDTKPLPRGFLQRTLATVYGYLLHAELFVGRDPANPPKGVYFLNVAKRLMQAYSGRFITVVFDSAYTSIRLCTELLRDGVLAIGKWRSDRAPPHIRDATLSDGQWVSSQSKSDPALSVTAWEGKTRREFVVSTSTALPMQTIPPKPKAQLNTPLPSAVATYNANCGGVDTSNRWAVHPWLHRKHYQWWRTFFEHFVNVAIGNAWVLYTQFLQPATPDLKPKSLDDFALELALELIGTYNARQRATDGTRLPSSVTDHTHSAPPNEHGVTHARKHCTVCTANTTWKCTCGKVVCNGVKGCWKKHLDRVKSGH
jgi:hypothetical protein